MDTKKALAASIDRHKLLHRGDRVLVAVSGGPDSVALLHLLHELKDEWALHLEVAHLQHGIRGDEAKQDAQFVRELADTLNLAFHLREIDLPRLHSQAGKGNLEALARAERYRFFADVVASRKLSKVAIAHTLDDQAETVLMWFLRGAGMQGLGGMAPCQELRIAGETRDPIVLIRPLLDRSKDEILDYLRKKTFAYRVDQSNRDIALLRNWLRWELLPKIRQRAGSGFPARLSQGASLLRDENAYLDQLTRERCEAALVNGNLSRGAVLNEPTALQRRIVRHWIAKARGHLRGVDFAHIEAVLRLIKKGPAQGRLSIPGEWQVVREYEELRLQKWSRCSSRICYSYGFEVGRSLWIREASMELHSQRLAASSARLPADMMEAIFDASSLTAPLLVRNFRHGDRFKPLGLAGHKKIKNLFIDKKLPFSVRAGWPLLTMGKEILWIPGYGRSETGLVSERTLAVIHLKALVLQT